MNCSLITLTKKQAPIVLALLFAFSENLQAVSVTSDSNIYNANKNNCNKSLAKRQYVTKGKAQCKLDVNLVSGFAIPSVDGTVALLSKNGDQAYLFYGNFQDNFPATIIQQQVAQLYNNVNGQLVLAKTFPFDPKLPLSYFGLASKDFSKFSVLQANEVANMRISVLDQNFNVTAQRTFIDPSFSYVMGGSFSEDNHYLLFAYAFPAPAPSVSYNSLIYILDATKPDLPTVAGPITISGFDPYFIGPMTLFELKDRKGKTNLYLSFMSAQFNSVPVRFTPEPPYFSQVYKIDVNAGTIKLIDQVPLPKFAETSVFVRKNQKEALICYGGQCSINPAAPNIYIPIDPQQVGDLPPDYNAIRLLRFDGTKLTTILKQPSNCCSFVVAYPPHNGLSYFIGQSVDNFLSPGGPARGPNPQEFWSIFDLEKGPIGLTLRPQSQPLEDLKTGNTSFSQDGKWLLRVGAYGYVKPNKPHVDSVGIKNVLLFRVSSNKYKKVCKLKF